MESDVEKNSSSSVALLSNGTKLPRTKFKLIGACQSLMIRYIIWMFAFVVLFQVGSGFVGCLTCLNGGTCTDEAGSYTCSCGAGYYGENCESDPLDECSWSDIWGNDIGAGTYYVPTDGCRMKKNIMVKVDVTIEGVSGSFHELQSNRVANSGGTANSLHRHFRLYSPGKLTLNYLKLTWGEAGTSGYGGFIAMNSGTLAINWVHFDGRSKTTGSHARSGGCISVGNGKVRIKESTFEGFRATYYGGAMHVSKTSTPMTIESTTFKNNEADVRFIFTLAFSKFIFFTSFLVLIVFILSLCFFVTSKCTNKNISYQFFFFLFGIYRFFFLFLSFFFLSMHRLKVVLWM